MGKQINSLYRYSITGTPAVPVKDWRGWSGGGSEKEMKLDYEGSRKEIVEGKPTYKDITITTGYDLDRDEGWITNIIRAFDAGPVEHTLTRQAITPQGALKGKPVIYEGCRLKNWDLPDGEDGTTADVGVITLIYAHKGVK